MPTEKNFGMRLTPTELRQIERLAQVQDMSMKEAVLGAGRRQLDELGNQACFVPSGWVKGAKHLIASFDGPSDVTM